MDALSRIFNSTGAERRAWLTRQERAFGDALSYYLGPAAQPLHGLARAVGEFSDAADFRDAYEYGGRAGDALSRGQYWQAAQDAAQSAAATGAIMAPGVSMEMLQAPMAIFAGIKARNAPLDALSRAEAMRDAGAGRDEIWQETGWFWGADGKPRFEIDDSGYSSDIRGAADERVAFQNDNVEAVENATRIAYRARNRGLSLKDAAQSVADDTGVSPRLGLDLASKHSPEDLLQMVREQQAVKFDPYEQPFQLDHVVNHEDLFAAYPDVTERPLQVGGKGLAQFRASYDPKEDSFFLQKYLDKDEDFSVGHEIQHAVQEREKFARGGNSFTAVREQVEPLLRRKKELESSGAWDGFDVWRNAPQPEIGGKRPVTALQHYKAMEIYSNAHPEDVAFREIIDLEARIGDLQSKGFESYERLAGEVEARNVQKRRNMTAAERRATPPWETQDVPDTRQIVRMR